LCRVKGLGGAILVGCQLPQTQNIGFGSWLVRNAQFLTQQGSRMVPKSHDRKWRRDAGNQDRLHEFKRNKNWIGELGHNKQKIKKHQPTKPRVVQAQRLDLQSTFIMSPHAIASAFSGMLTWL
jgi:hypothetical protein